LRFFVISGYNGRMNILLGKPVAEAILADLKEKISKEKSAPGLAVVLVGNDKASRIYVGLKEKKAKEIGMDFSLFQFPAQSREDEIILKIRGLNKDGRINGIIVQVPLPEKFDTQRIINEISPEKDVDGFHPESIDKFERGTEIFWPVFPKAIIALLESSQENVSGKNAVVVANSEKFGEVMKSALERKGLLVEYVLSKDISKGIEKIKNADIVVTAVGEPGIIDGGMLKGGAVVIDGGITEEKEKVLGDVDTESVRDIAGYVSPVPGGVGPVTIASLLENVYIAYKLQNK